MYIFINALGFFVVTEQELTVFNFKGPFIIKTEVIVKTQRYAIRLDRGVKNPPRIQVASLYKSALSFLSVDSPSWLCNDMWIDDGTP